jgi:hypothetical protein
MLVLVGERKNISRVEVLPPIRRNETGHYFTAPRMPVMK